MHYGLNRPDSLTFDPFKAIVAPRPIGWIGTVNAQGVPNLAPYSFFMPLGSEPHMIAFTSEGLKHSASNALHQQERFLVIGQVVQTPIRDEYIRDGRFDTAAVAPISRLGYRDYATADALWELQRPGD